MLFLLSRPVYVLRRLAYKVYEIRHPDEPWIAQDAVRFLDRALQKNHSALEWGSGRSTRWFAARVEKILSIEQDPQWHGKVVADLADVRNAECRLIPIEHAIDTPTHPHYEKWPAYVAVVDQFADASLDLVVVDGHYRQACIQRALPKIRSGGLLVVDNTNWLPLADWGVPAAWSIVHQSSNVMTQTTIWKKQ